MNKTKTHSRNLAIEKKDTVIFCKVLPNGLRYLRWGGDGEAVRLEKCKGVRNCLRLPQNPQRQVHALLGSFCF